MQIAAPATEPGAGRPPSVTSQNLRTAGNIARRGWIRDQSI